MATIFKSFLNNDVATTRTLLHEAVPITGTIPSGTYTAEANIKNYAHGMFQSVYDYPFLSSSANHIFDVTVGFHSTSPLSQSSPNDYSQQGKKINIYNQMAQILVGHDETGSIRKFDADGDLSGGTKMDACVFVNFARLLGKDELKKGSFSMTFATGGNPPRRQFSTSADPNALISINDSGSATDYRVNSPAGEYGILYVNRGGGDVLTHKAGLIYYQAGVAVITSSLWRGGFPITNDGGSAAQPRNQFGPPGSGSYNFTSHSASINAMLSGSSISGACDGFRNSLTTLSFNNTTELNSTIYFCRASHNEFNYTSNPTYLSASKIVTKNKSTDMPVSYITSVGLYSADNELLAVAKLSEPLKKTPTNELTLRVRLDY
tara:strand:- start:5863 stop:6993 length:1131 start_codon:yes stop_codon:yes gene_type:complete